MKKLFTILMVGFILVSCKDNEAKYNIDSSGDVHVPVTAMATADEMVSGRNSKLAFTSQSQSVEKKVIQNGNLRIKVDDLSAFLESLRPVLSKFEAYTTNESQNTYDRVSESNLTIRVPEKNFGDLFGELKGLGKSIESQSLNQRDVTEEFIDLETRLKNKKALEQRYRQLLNQAKNVNDILNIERQLNNVRSEIESQEGRLKYLNSQVSFSTIQLTAFVNKPYVYEPEETDGFFQRFLKSLSEGWQFLVDSVLWIFGTWPIWIVLVAIIFNWKRRKK